MILAFISAFLITVFAMISYPDSQIKTIPTFIIERQLGGQWERSIAKFRDTTIIDTVNIDGIITYHSTEYSHVIGK